MNLTEFLATANADDNLALSEAQAYNETTYRKIGSNEARQFFSMFGAVNNIEAGQSNTTVVQLIAGVDTTIGELCKTMLATLNGEGRFSTDPATQDGALNRAAAQAIVNAGVLQQNTIDQFFATSETTTQPFANATLEQVKAIRNPATWKAVTIASGNDKLVLPEGDAILSASNKGAFRFTLTPAEAFNGQVQIRIKAKKSGETTFTAQPQYPITVSVSSADVIAQTFQRVAGLSGYRHFIFEYLEPYNGALTSVSVEGVA